jgi:Rieske Fe-S protein
MTDDKHDKDDAHAPAAPPDPELVGRRRLLARVSVGLGAASGVALGVPMAGFVVGPLFHGMTPQPSSPDALEWRTVGKLSADGKSLMMTTDDGATSVVDFSPGTTLEAPVVFEDASSLPWSGVTGRTAAYLRRVSETECVAFAINCAHLGCPVRWFSESQLFMCPCHGGVYYADGSRASGPPERGLFTYDYKVENGKLFIDAGQIPTFSNRAQLIRGIGPCPGTEDSTIG